jgi:hypothetical protein
MPVNIGEVNSAVEVDSRGGETPATSVPPAPPTPPDALRWRLASLAVQRDAARLHARDQDD